MKTDMKPRKNPRQRRSSETVATILEAAARVLESSGLEGYNTNAIAARAGVSIGSLYQYFPSKDAITRKLIAREMSLLHDGLQGIDALPTGRVALQHLVTVAVNSQLKRPVLARVLDLEETRLPPDEDVERLADHMSQLIRHCLFAADLPDTARAPEAVGDLIAIIKGMVDSAGRRGETDASALVRRVNKAVFGYVGDAFPEQ
jgi:AcrR family transcriptional regulator